MKFENTEVIGFENAIIGARLPMCKDLEEAKEYANNEINKMLEDHKHYINVRYILYILHKEGVRCIYLIVTRLKITSD